MSAAPFISNDTFIFYSDMILIDTLSVSQINNMYMNALHEPKNKHMVVFVKTELLIYIRHIIFCIWISPTGFPARISPPGFLFLRDGSGVGLCHLVFHKE